MDARILRGVAALVVLALAGLTLLIAARGNALGDDLSLDSPLISEKERAAGATYDPGVPPADRAWIDAALVAARPEAQRLIAEVNGQDRYDILRARRVGVWRFI